MNVQQRAYLEKFGNRVTFDRTERTLYGHDMAAMPSLVKPLIGDTTPDAVVQPRSEEELADVKAYFTGTMPIRLETADGRARMLHSIEYFQLGPDYLARYPDLVQRVTREQVLRAAQEHINIDTYSLVIAGPVNE